jgi:aconitate decarboxylase
MSATSAPAPSPPPVSRDLAGWLAAQRLADIPASTRERAKHLLLDGIGCGLVGARLPWSESATAALCRLEGDGPAALIGTGRSTTPTAAALLNSSDLQGFELDDYHPVAPVHGAPTLRRSPRSWASGGRPT